MSDTPSRRTGIRLHVSNKTPDPFVRPYKAFALDLAGEARIVLGHKQVTGRFTYYRTEYPIAIAEYLDKPYRRFITCLRWNQNGDSFDLERMFGHRGRPARLVSWATDLQFG